MSNDDTFVWPAEFICTIIDETVILPNHYSIKVFIEPYVPITEGFAIGFEKIKHIIFNVLDHSILVNRKNPLAEALSGVSNNIVYLPTEPYDYYFGSLLFSKFNAVASKYFSIYQITIDSAVGDRVQYTISDTIDSIIEMNDNDWWNQDNPSTGSNTKVSWEGLPFNDSSKFHPQIIKGGKSEH